MNDQGTLSVAVRDAASIAKSLDKWSAAPSLIGAGSSSGRLEWLSILRSGLGHTPMCIEAQTRGRTVGLLPLALIKGPLFGRFLVSLPYLNTSGVQAETPAIAHALIDRAIELADDRDVRYLELRHETEVEHPALTETARRKVHMRRALPATGDALWSDLTPKVRNQIRKGQRQDFAIEWGGMSLLDAFYKVFSHNMRDLGTPVFSKRLFDSILRAFPDSAEICVVRAGRKPIAAALLMHGEQITEVPSASSLRAFNSTNANMLLYWHLLERATERGQATFDFGRSSRDSGTYRFKRQWGAEAHPAVWQYYVRKGGVTEMRPDHGRYRSLVRLWRRLPVRATRVLGPPIVRGIP